MNAQTTTHSLRYYGAAFDAEGNLINPDTKVTTGTGHAVCTCGWVSDEQPNGARRRVAHKLHKLHIEEAAAPEAEQTELVLGQDVIEGTPEDEVAEALEEAAAEAHEDEVLADQAAHEETLTEDAPEVDGDTPDSKDVILKDAVVFPTTVAKHFYRSLGRKGAEAILDRHFPTVSAKFNATVREIELSGPNEDACDAAEAIIDMWDQAIAAFAQWLKTDATYLAMNKEGLEGRNATYHAKEAFFVDYATAYAEAMDES